MAEEFTPAECLALAPYFTNVDRPVFALVNLPESVKGALFARYSRSAKSLRRLFLDEFLEKMSGTTPPALTSPGPLKLSRAEELYERVLVEYGDDSVAQLGGVHLACEGASNILTKVLEWGRLMAYLEQSTRYVPYDDKPGSRFRYRVPEELTGDLRVRYVETLDAAFETYAAWLPRMREFFEARYPRQATESPTVYRSTIRAKALDTLRGLLPAATISNVGIYGTGQAYEALLLRMRVHPLAEVRAYADEMLRELRKVIPAFLRRVDAADRGGAWSEYLADARLSTQAAAARALDGVEAEPRDEVTLSDFDPDGEVKVIAAALYATSGLPDDQLRDVVRRMSTTERERVLAAYVGRRANRRHRPGRAFEATRYRFDVLGDYGAFRDLQRHRLLTLEWQPLSPRHGHVTPSAIEEAGALEDWTRVMRASRDLHGALVKAGLVDVAPYAVAMAYRVRFYMDMNAREAMHVIELRTAPQGHPAYRRICQRMHRLIAEGAGHRAIASAMTFADHSEVALERLEAERAAERRRQGS
jgi:thymidylate synthase ThyX